ncbi:M23 family peptidase [Streptomyces sp. NPDC014846]|uniref:M23 family peptidase n=1 Tax=Streptomyces sp. NPDC014846 TaxID=3364922 RepID=UPI0036FC8BB4
MRVVAGGVAALCAGVFCLPLALGAGGNDDGQDWQDACRPTTYAVRMANKTQTKPSPEPAPSTDAQVLVPLDPKGPQTRATWTATQVRNAATVTSVARTRGLPPRAAVIAVATAMQESSLTNLRGGDRDSVGLFQQRPSQGWGTVAQLTDPIYASSKFYDTLVKVSGWQTKPLSRAAQSVQRSGLPGAYAKWEREAGALVAKAWGSHAYTSISAGCDSDGSNDPVGHFTVKNPRVATQAIVAAGGASGSSGWYRRCDNFVSQAYGWGSSGSASANVHWSRLVHMGLAHPGDNNPPPGALLFYDTGESAGHVALYLGGDMVASNDILGAGTIGIVHREDVTDGTWRLRYRGWTEPAFPDAGGSTTI